MPSQRTGLETRLNYHLRSRWMAPGLYLPILYPIHPQVLRKLVIIVIEVISYGHIQSDLLGDAVLCASRFSMARSRSARARLLKTPINHLVENKKSHFTNLFARLPDPLPVLFSCPSGFNIIP